MTKTVPFFSAPVAPPDSSPALENPAVAHCCEVWESTRRQALNAGCNMVIARVAAHKAFQKSLPPLTGLENIRNFIACVAHGMLVGAILSPDGARLLYAAQIVKSAANSPARQRETVEDRDDNSPKETPSSPLCRRRILSAILI
jgi:hypothetical protein